MNRVRVLLFLRAPGAEQVAVGYHRISTELAGTPGLLGNELLRDVHQPERFIVISEWSSHAAFLEWESGAAHRGVTAPLREFQDPAVSPPFGVFEITARY